MTLTPEQKIERIAADTIRKFIYAIDVAESEGWDAGSHMMEAMRFAQDAGHKAIAEMEKIRAEEAGNETLVCIAEDEAREIFLQDINNVT